MSYESRLSRSMHACAVTVLFLGLFAARAHGQGLWLAKHHANTCDYEMALVDWSLAPTEQQQSFDGRLLKARILIQLERGPEASKIISALQAEAGEVRTVELLLAMGLAQSAARQFEPAEKALLAARAKGADSDLIDAAIAEIRLSSGRVMEAEAMLRQLLRRAPDLAGPMMNLATIRAREGHLVEAAALIRLAWELGYQNPQELRKAPDFEKIRASGLIHDLLSEPSGRCRIY